MTVQCERRGQLEIGAIDHEGQVFVAFEEGVSGHNVTGYTSRRNGSVDLTRWDGISMLGCRSDVVREYGDGSLALVFRLRGDRFIVGHALGENGMLFRG
jgi:hypothetical protein